MNDKTARANITLLNFKNLISLMTTTTMRKICSFSHFRLRFPLQRVYVLFLFRTQRLLLPSFCVILLPPSPAAVFPILLALPPPALCGVFPLLGQLRIRASDAPVRPHIQAFASLVQLPIRFFVSLVRPHTLSVGVLVQLHFQV